jgi:ketosteroid isomerase-like protein
MAYLDTTSSQLKAIDEFFAAYRTRDIKNAEPLMAKDCKYKYLPDHPDLPEMTKEQHIQLYAAMVAACTGFDVRISEHHGTASKFTC